jgi:hypothetical protein
MISLYQLKEKASRKYWTVIKAALKGESIFPFIIPADKKLPGKFEEFQQAVGELVEFSKDKKGWGYTLTLKKRVTRKYSTQSIPVLFSFDTQVDYLRFVGKQEEAESILRVAENLGKKFPALRQWIEKNPKKIHEHIKVWDSIINVLLYFRSNPKPRMYTRELPINIHTKFIEKNKGILRELLEHVIPEFINKEGETFEKQFHLKSPPALIRMRQLDSTIDTDIFSFSDDLAVPFEVFNRLAPRSRFVVISENLMTFLTLPLMKQAIGIYGSGFQVEMLKDAPWLKSKTIIYWGDIDAHGFIILSRVRRSFPSATSILMDEETFNCFEDWVARGPDSAINGDIEKYLTPQELTFYRFLQKNNYRLEQEHISQHYVSARFENLMKNFGS